MQEMERVAQETMDKAVTYQNELENQKLSGQKQVVPRGVSTVSLLRPGVPDCRRKRCCVLVLTNISILGLLLSRTINGNSGYPYFKSA